MNGHGTFRGQTKYVNMSKGMLIVTTAMSIITVATARGKTL